MSHVDPPFGMVFFGAGAGGGAAGDALEARRIEAGAGAGGQVVGSLLEGELPIIELDGDRSLAVHDPRSGALTPLNRDRASAEGFLEAFAHYLETGPAPAGPVILTAEQAAAKLAALRAGTLKPGAARRGQLPHTERLRILRETLTRIDPGALGASGWWAGPLEEAGDDLL
ncbi:MULTISPECIES: hypothetical protein [unclassified Leucobacter]|uniref:hypothetical protein n=1 Tax=unclassified Leucobacter TaxID=2621730 RepID=UPI0006226302|nr:hypothetical protein [Leucobacter sp. Ag1]KKI22541.1 hypothetical protein XM48_01180 [Leucobacter sp. Ag1]